jgi:hypothetical protein
MILGKIKGNFFGVFFLLERKKKEKREKKVVLFPTYRENC